MNGQVEHAVNDYKWVLFGYFVWMLGPLLRFEIVGAQAVMWVVLVIEEKWKRKKVFGNGGKEKTGLT